LQEPFAGSVDEPEKSVWVECKQRYIDDIDDATEKRRGFDGARAFVGEKIGESIDLQCEFAERVIV
jgi:hypothetical protein